MLKITVPGRVLFNEETDEIITVKEQHLQLEHSLVSLSKWESKWCKPFIKTKEKTYEETIDYYRCMTITQNVDPNVYYCLTKENQKEIDDYIDAPMTATWFNDRDSESGREIVTAEIIYFWMIDQGIPFECQKWHLNRLLTLIRVCSLKRAPKKKMSMRETMEYNNKLNEARRKAAHSKG
jgi:hypothetical protein